MYIIWTDGSYRPSVNSGGYSAVITKNDKIITTLYRGYTNTTNNRMELMGVLEALRYFHVPTKMIIYSDSQYVVNSMENGHVEKWFRENDLSKKNLDLWREILDLSTFHNVKFRWVKGHNSNEMNEFADLLAVHAGHCLNLLNDDGFSKNFNNEIDGN